MKALLFVIVVNGTFVGNLNVDRFEVVEFSSMERCQMALAKVADRAFDPAVTEISEEHWRGFCVEQ